MNDTPLHSVSVAGVTFDDAGRVLVIRRRDNGQWQPPGGVLEHDESIEEAVIREVLEETGIEVEPERLTGIYKNIPNRIVALVFRCKFVSGLARVSSESSDVEWVSLDEATRRMSAVFAARLRDAASREVSARVRAHDGQRLL